MNLWPGLVAANIVVWGWAFGLNACAGGSSNLRVPTREEMLLTHQRACEAKGNVIVSMAYVMAESCPDTAMKLQVLVATDEDCVAFFGDAGVSTDDLCGDGPAPRDGGARDGTGGAQ